jgi:hypothetical protein
MVNNPSLNSLQQIPKCKTPTHFGENPYPLGKASNLSALPRLLGNECNIIRRVQQGIPLKNWNLKNQRNLDQLGNPMRDWNKIGTRDGKWESQVLEGTGSNPP